jgi:hypothetical protein
MTLRANAPAAFAPVALPPSTPELPSRGFDEADAPSPVLDDPGTWVPALGGSITLCFLGQPASSAAPANNNAIDMIFFILLSIQLT